MSSPLYIKISDKDNVAIAVNDIPAGTLVMDGVRAKQDIPQAHKIALCDIPEGGKIIRYGVVLGYAINPIGKGQWINEKMLELPTPNRLFTALNAKSTGAASATAAFSTGLLIIPTKYVSAIL